MTDQEARVAMGVVSEEPQLPHEIFNLTRHVATWDQRIMGVVEAGPRVQQEVYELMTFTDAIPDTPELERRAKRLSDIAKLSGCPKALIGGPSFIMSLLELRLLHAGIIPVFAFNTKDKRGVWKFQGFVESPLAERGCLNE